MSFTRNPAPSQTPRIDECDHMLCPHCGGHHITHERVDVYWRGEDKVQGTHVCTTSEGTSVDGHMLHNPSARRWGLNIYFSCEWCGHGSQLSISQHKGHTVIEHK